MVTFSKTATHREAKAAREPSVDEVVQELTRPPSPHGLALLQKMMQEWPAGLADGLRGMVQEMTERGAAMCSLYLADEGVETKERVFVMVSLWYAIGAATMFASQLEMGLVPAPLQQANILRYAWFNKLLTDVTIVHIMRTARAAESEQEPEPE